MPLKRRTRILALALAVVFALAVAILNSMGVFLFVKPACACRCEPLRGIPGPEDLVIDHATGRAYISSYDRRAMLRGESPRGALFAYRPGQDSRPRDITPALPFDFRPHGLSLYAPARGEKLLFVINHRRDGQYVEIFALKGAGLEHRASITHPAITSPNDLAAAGPRSFYITNDHRFASGPLRHVEETLGLPLSNLVYFDGSGARVVATGLAYANSVAVSPDGTAVYVTETTGRRFRAYRRDPATNDLEQEATLGLPLAADNLDIDPDGRIWVAGHPNVALFMRHALTPGAAAPSLAGTVTRNAKGRWGFRAVYADDGRRFSAASVAARHGELLLLGGIFDNGILECHLTGGGTHD